jgi:hypothetical protein
MALASQKGGAKALILSFRRFPTSSKSPLTLFDSV